MNARTKAVLFDIGGVVVDDRGLKIKVQAIFPDVSPEALWRLLNVALLPACRGEANRSTCWRTLAAALGVSPAPEALAALWDTVDFVNGIRINHDVVRLVRALRRRYKLGVISNTMHEHAIALRQMGVYGEFDEVVLSHEVGLTKDRAEIFYVALSRLQIEPHEAIFIDDFEAYVEVARSVGMRAILFSGVSMLSASFRDAGILCD